MNIAILNTLYHPFKVGGAEVSVQILAESLAQSGHHVSVITLSDGNEIENDHLNLVKIYRLPLKNIYWPYANEHHNPLKKLLWHMVDNYNFFSKQELRKVLKEISPDVLHTNNIAGFSVSAWDVAFDLNIPIIHTSRDYYLIHPNTKLNSKSKDQSPLSIACKAWGFFKKIKSKKVCSYVSISQHVMDIHCQTGFFSHQLKSVIYNPIETPAQNENTVTPDTEITYGYIGGLNEAKGIEVLIAAFPSTPSGKNLLIAGNGNPNYVEKLKRLAKNKNIKFIGHVTPNEFYPKINCLVVPSLWAEPLGRVVLESYSYGIPVIAAHSGGIPEIVKEGNTGFLYEKYSTENLNKLITEHKLQTYISMKNNCLHYSKNFSKQKNATAYFNTYLATTIQ